MQSSRKQCWDHFERKGNKLENREDNEGWGKRGAYSASEQFSWPVLDRLFSSRATLKKQPSMGGVDLILRFSLKHLHLSKDPFFFLSGCLASLASQSFLSTAFSTQWDTWQVRPMHCWPLCPLRDALCLNMGGCWLSTSDCCFFGPKLLLSVLKSTIIARLTSCLLLTNWRAGGFPQTQPSSLSERT